MRDKVIKKEDGFVMPVSKIGESPCYYLIIHNLQFDVLHCHDKVRQALCNKGTPILLSFTDEQVMVEV